MRAKFRSAAKPPSSMPMCVDWSEGLSNGLIYCTLANTPGQCVDVVRGFNAPFTGTTTRSASGIGIGTLADANGEGAKNLSVPAHMRAADVTLIWRGIVFGAGTVGSLFAGMSTNNTDTAPRLSYALYRSDGGTQLGGGFNNAAVFGFLGSSTIVYGVVEEYALTVKDAAQALYRNGVLLTSSGNGGAISYDSDAVWGVMSYSNTARNANSLTHGVWVYNRVLQQQDIMRHWLMPWSMLRSVKDVRPVAAASGFMPAWAVRSNQILSGGVA